MFIFTCALTGRSPDKPGVSFEVAVNCCDGTPPRAPLEFSHELRDREGALKDLASHASANFSNRTQTDHKNHIFFLVTGGSGIGKSRLGYEAGRPGALAPHLPAGADARLVASLQNPCYIHINFNDDEKFDHRVDRRPASQRLGIRLATAGLLHKSLDTFVTACPNLSVVTVASVLTNLIKQRLEEDDGEGKDNKSVVFIVVHLDEFQFYIDAAAKAGLADPRGFFKEVLNVLGQFMREGASDRDLHGRFFILPIVTGTSAIDVHFLPAEYSGKAAWLAPLGEEATMEMCTAALGEDCVSAVDFRVARDDCGGVPHYLHKLLQVPFNDGVAWGATLSDSMRSLALEDFGGMEGAVAVVQFAIAGQRTTRSFVMPGGLTIGELERKGSVFLTGQGLVTIHLPFVVLKKLNLLLTQRGHPILDDNLLFFPSSIRPWRWQDFEELHAHVQAVRINALLAAQAAEIKAAKNKLAALELPGYAGDEDQETKRLAKIDAAKDQVQELEAERDRGFQLRAIIPGAFAAKTLLSTRLRLRPVRCVHELELFLASTTQEVAVVDEVECHEGKMELEEGVFLAAKNNALFDGRFACPRTEVGAQVVVTFWQDKHSEGDPKSDTVSAGDVSAWHDAAFKATKLWRTAGYVVVLLYVTNRHLTESLSVLHELEGLAVVSRAQLRSYLSPTFCGRGLISS